MPTSPVPVLPVPLSRRQALRLVPGSALAIGAVMISGCRRNCGESEPLTESSKAMRVALKYTEHSELPGNTCGTCVQFVDGGFLACGGCHFFAGGVNPDGHCISFSAKTT